MHGFDVEESRGRDELLAEIERLENELERYRADAERTRTLFVSMTNYAQKVREDARREAELALRKARGKAERLAAATHDLERIEQELERKRQELTRLRLLTAQTHRRLSTFLTAGLEALNAQRAFRRLDTAKPAHDDLDEALREQLTSTQAVTADDRAEVDR